ncbi:hypothetical protein FLB_02420 [Flavobacterium succinicans]|uniref:Transposase n=1 Tax=Flavobacterium succinicans TaxID=29536 RepID=A0A199XUB2_9FLAO|nr:hypothetical protein FLB_02420 [Flavobacterium succinicans]
MLRVLFFKSNHIFLRKIFKIILGQNFYYNNCTHAIYAAAETFTVKIKAFRSQFRGVRKIDFFLFRLSNLLHNPQLLNLTQYLKRG